MKSTVAWEVRRTAEHCPEILRSSPETLPLLSITGCFGVYASLAAGKADYSLPKVIVAHGLPKREFWKLNPSAQTWVIQLSGCTVTIVARTVFTDAKMESLTTKPVQRSIASLLSSLRHPIASGRPLLQQYYHQSRIWDEAPINDSIKTPNMSGQR